MSRHVIASPVKIPPFTPAFIVRRKFARAFCAKASELLAKRGLKPDWASLKSEVQTVRSGERALVFSVSSVDSEARPA